MTSSEPTAGWFPIAGRDGSWRWWDGRDWTTVAEWDGRRWVYAAAVDADRATAAEREPLALAQPWLLIFVAWVVLTVVGAVAGGASWHAGTVDATGCQTDSSVEPLTWALWLLGLGLAWGTVLAGRAWSRRHGLVGRVPLEVLLVPAALVLPWVVYLTGFNQCWN